MSFLDVPDNMGLGPSMAPRFMQREGVNMSQADMIQLAAIVSVRHCGGPNIPFRPGRIDTTTPTSPEGLVPGGNEPYPIVKEKLRRMVNIN